MRRSGGQRERVDVTRLRRDIYVTYQPMCGHCGGLKAWIIREAGARDLRDGVGCAGGDAYRINGTGIGKKELERSRGRTERKLGIGWGNDWNRGDIGHNGFRGRRG